jgi:glycosyltransferase involved in cell wall biosynthesis
MRGGGPHVVHVIAPGAYGGAESVVRAIASERARAGLPTSVAALTDDARHPFVAGLEQDGVPVIRIAAGGRQYLRQASDLAAHLDAAHADVVHTHVYHADFVGFAAARRAARPAVATYHGHVGGSWRNRLYEWSDRRLLRRFDAVVCVAERNRQRLLRSGCPARRLHVIANGLQAAPLKPRALARHLLGVPEEGLVIGWVGRLSEEKGPDLLLDALTRLDRRDVTTVMVGDGPDHAALAERLAAWRAPGPVQLAGPRAQAASLFSAFDLLAISSRTEGLPMVMLEAIAAEVPVVAFAVGGIPEVLDDATGWLARPLDCVDLAGQLSAACTDSAGRRRRALAARTRAEARLGGAAWIEALESVYARISARAAA